MKIENLNKKYLPLSPDERIRALYSDFNKVLLTSSFGTTSAILLYLFHKINPAQPIYFINTSYLFPETITYKDQLVKQLGLNVIELTPDVWQNKFTREDETWKKNPDFCCTVNKVEPIERVKKDYEVWVSGLLSYQSEYRKGRTIFEEKKDIIKFSPIIDMTEVQVKAYMKNNNLPPHPLEAEGYSSVGCTHCTVKGKGREGRWMDFSKTECGLHL